jgi:hypothetical protein
VSTYRFEWYLTANDKRYPPHDHQTILRQRNYYGYVWRCRCALEVYLTSKSHLSLYLMGVLYQRSGLLSKPAKRRVLAEEHGLYKGQYFL